MNLLQEILAKNPVVAAPMAGVSDKASRLIAREYGVDLVYTEMISAKALTYHNSKTFLLMNTEGERQPISVQIFGSEPDVVAEGARLMEAGGARIIDINMGCPVPKVVNNGEGSSLMKDPKRAASIVEAMVKAVNVPVTVKFRKGWDDSTVNAPEFGARMEAAGASAIAVHGRTRMQYYAGEADWDVIRQVKERVTSIPVIGNGDIFSPENAKEMMKQTGCDGVMIGRGALGRPWLYRQTIDFLKTGSYAPSPEQEEMKRVIWHHAQLIMADKGEFVAMKELRKHVAWYWKGMPHAARMRDMINNVTTMDELEKLLDLKLR